MALTRLIESVSDWDTKDISIKPIPISLTESTIKLKENTYPILGAYKIPVWLLDVKNRNGRYYTRPLADKVLQEKKVTLVLDGHPQEDNYIPIVDDAIAVGKNPTIETINGIDVLFAEVHFIDSKIYEKVKRAIDHGFLFEQSSSGLGDFLEDGCTVNPDTFFLERYFDVLTCDSSARISFGKENEITQDIQESVESKEIEEIIKENTEKENLTINAIDNKLQETKETKMVNKTVNIPLSMIRKDFDRHIQIAEAKEDLNERLESFTEIKAWALDTDCDGLKDIVESADKEIANILEQKEVLAQKGIKTDTLEEQVSELNKQIEGLTTKHDNLVESYDKACIMLDEIKKSNNTYKDLVEVQAGKLNTMVEANDYLKLSKDFEALEESKKLVESELTKSKAKVKSIIEKHNEQVANYKAKKLAEKKKVEASEKIKIEEAKAQEILRKQEEQVEAERLAEIEAKREVELDRIGERSEVKDYFAKLEDKHSAVVMKEFKDKILRSKTLAEATIEYFKLRGDIEKMEEAIEESTGEVLKESYKPAPIFNPVKKVTGRL